MRILITWACALGFAAGLGATQAAAEVGARVPLVVCNDFWSSFRIAINGGGPMALRSGRCVEARVAPGRHALFPIAVTIPSGWFRERGYVVDVPPEGARVRFGERNVLADIVSVERATVQALGGEGPPAGEPFFFTSVPGLPWNGLFMCGGASLSMADVLADRMTPFFTPLGDFSPLAAGVGQVGSLGLYTPWGDPVCSPILRAGSSPGYFGAINRPRGVRTAPIAFVALPRLTAASLRGRLVQSLRSGRGVVFSKSRSASRSTNRSARFPIPSRPVGPTR